MNPVLMALARKVKANPSDESTASALARAVLDSATEHRLNTSQRHNVIAQERARMISSGMRAGRADETLANRFSMAPESVRKTAARVRKLGHKLSR